MSTSVAPRRSLLLRRIHLAYVHYSKKALYFDTRVFSIDCVESLL